MLPVFEVPSLRVQLRGWRQVTAGNSGGYITRRIDITSNEPAADEALTPAELRAINLMAQGLKYSEIAVKFHCSEWNVKHILKKAYDKMGARNRAHAVLMAVKLGYVTVPDDAE